MNSLELYENLDFFMEKAKENIESDGHLQSVLLMNMKENGVIVVPVQLPNKESKINLVSNLITMISEDKLYEYLFIAEAWMAKNDLDDVQRHLSEHGTLENYDSRMECVVFQYGNPSIEVMSIAEIIRNGDSLNLNAWEKNETKEGVLPRNTLFGNLFSKAKSKWN